MKVRLPIQQLSKKQQSARDTEIRRQAAEINEQFLDDAEKMLMYVLKKQEGYGPKRMKKTYMGFTRLFKEILDKYIFDGPDDVMWYVDKELKDAGVDIDAWHEECEEIYKDERDKNG